MIAAYIDKEYRSTGSAQAAGRLVRNKIMTRMDMVNAANNWFVVPTEAKMRRLDHHHQPRRRPKPVTNVIKVATKTLT